MIDVDHHHYCTSILKMLSMYKHRPMISVESQRTDKEVLMKSIRPWKHILKKALIEDSYENVCRIDSSVHNNRT